jgi:hypothetical protein
MRALFAELRFAVYAMFIRFARGMCTRGYMYMYTGVYVYPVREGPRSLPPQVFGFTNVLSLEGGLRAWLREGLPVQVGRLRTARLPNPKCDRQPRGLQ